MPYTIFIVEDHPVMLEAYLAILASTPEFELGGTAASAEEALSTLGEVDCDLVVTDYRLPGLNGADLVRHLHATWPDLPVVVISAHEDEAFVRSAREAGASAVIGKRDLVDTFGPTLLAVLETRRVAPRRDAA